MVFAKTTLIKEHPRATLQPWQRGTNENTNGLLREYFPKGQDLTDIAEDHIQEVFDELNKRPRKCLGYRTSYEVFYKKKLHLT